MASRTRSHLPIELPANLRHHRCAVARWALEEGQSLNVSALTVILECRRRSATLIGGFTEWDATEVSELLWSGAAAVCLEHGTELPSGTAETLWAYLTFLDQAGTLQGSTLSGLREELANTAGLDRHGRLRHPSGGRGPLAPVVTLPVRSA